MKLIIDIPENIIEGAKSSPNYYPIYHFEKMWRAIINGIPLDNLRAEIDEQKNHRGFDEDDMCIYKEGLVDALEIIDKYKEEQE